MNDRDFAAIAQRPQTLDHGRLMTIVEAAAITGRNPEVLRRWVRQGTLHSRYQQATWPYATLVSWDDLAAIITKRRWGTRRGRKPRTLTTEGGLDVRLRTATRTDSWQE